MQCKSMKNEEINQNCHSKIWIIKVNHRTLYQHSRQGECIRIDYKHLVLPQG